MNQKVVLLKPVITEKSLRLVEEYNQYTFSVASNVNKIEVARAVADQWKVKVEKVRVISLRGKKVRFGRRRVSGNRTSRNRAIVTLQTGDKIDLFELK